MGMPAVAADWADDWGSEVDFRTGYSNEPKDWSGVGETDDSLHFETGLRYWYSMGSQSFEALGDSFESSDTTHVGELHLRIDDYDFRHLRQGFGGILRRDHRLVHRPQRCDASVDGGKVAYAGADFGWNVFSDGNGSGAGFLVGYQYWNDSPRTSRQNFTTAHSAADLSFDPIPGKCSCRSTASTTTSMSTCCGSASPARASSATCSTFRARSLPCPTPASAARSATAASIH